MIFGINLLLLAGIILPAIIYSLILYLTSPYKSIKLKESFRYVAGGATSVIIVSLLDTVLPGWSSYYYESFFQQFFYVAPREEIAKFIAFIFVSSTLQNNKDKHPSAIMFYYCMIGLGFATVENMQYYSMYGGIILTARIFTSCVAHMLFGLFAGYWIALSKIDQSKYTSRSVFNVFSSKYKRFKMFIYTIIGLLCAIGYHGLWNYNLHTSAFAANSIMIFMLFVGLAGAKFASVNLTNKYAKTLKISKK